MADQALSKGQRVNIGSPGSFFRPVYATIAGTKRSSQGKMQGKLQIISTSVLSDTELLAQTQQCMQVFTSESSFDLIASQFLLCLCNDSVSLMLPW